MGRISDAREKLLAAALDLIWTSSYGSVSVDDICVRAKVNKGSFYHFFPSKSDLAVAAYEAHWQLRRPQWDAIFSSQHEPLDRLEKWCEAIYAMQLEKFEKYGHVVGCPYANAGSELATQDPKIRAKTQEMLERGLRYLEATIADAQRLNLIEVTNTKATAKQISCSVLGLMMQAKIENNLAVLEELTPTILRLLGLKLALA
jgi:TetR/AcrR family transcriptional regulator, transcriptional repressor for nem operon